MSFKKRSFKKAKSYGKFKKTARRIHPMNTAPRGGFSL